MTVIIPTSPTIHLAKNMEKKVKVLYLEGNKDGKRSFPDGELYTRVPVEKIGPEENVVVLHSGQPNPNEGLVELYSVIYALEEEAIRPKLFFSYFPYSRQDKVFKTGEPNMTRKLLEDLSEHSEEIYIIDFHSNEDWVEKLGIKKVSAVSLLKQRVEKTYGQLEYFSPDKGGEKRTDIKGAEKDRNGSRKVEIKLSREDKKRAKGKNAAVLDDIISTGKTMCNTYKELKSAGAKKIIAIATHGVLPEGIERVKNTYDDLILANTINRKEANVNVSPLILKEIR